MKLACFNVLIILRLGNLSSLNFTSSSSPAIPLILSENNTSHRAITAHSSSHSKSHERATQALVADTVEVESATFLLHLMELGMNASTIADGIPHSKPTVNMSPSVDLLPPNDASIITLLAAEAKCDHELEAQLNSSKLVKPGHPFSPVVEMTPLGRRILDIHQRLQKEHGLLVDPAIYDPAGETSWSFERTWGVRVSQLRKSYWVVYRVAIIADCSSSPNHTLHTRH